MLPIFNLLDDTLQPVPNTLHGIRAQNQPQRRIRAMPELPDKMRGLDGAGGLLVTEPEEHPFCMGRGRGGRAVGRTGGFDEKVTVEWERGGEGVFVSAGGVVAVVIVGILVGFGIVRDQMHDIVAAHMPRLNQRRFDIKAIHLI